ncbi:MULTISPECIES: type IV secretion system DNA-binding domain-containing protein [Pseudonocardia]|uniref:AAA-like domain protein n=2 Tax=Pseudonocardia TaxID=1847 RepID=A0A1Y2MKT1_PSEAH|nr:MULTISPECIES: type IV secretion system DNA-binding domain-containing protein [Pseudonocardia]OSY35078.1 AAA-like domain protein [Pseudonocardia autotrophica]TDN72097.1 type IV secretion system coupling TraD/TrwB family protein [Pseudonocardia autotrophica]BBG02800.1 hypothetical protein Pdca_40090 [Pseudonocardia autotrophica]GEC26119.1 hypothetical protein PSA01_31480 [Pseudonocardia saturnea]
MVTPLSAIPLAEVLAVLGGSAAITAVGVTGSWTLRRGRERRDRHGAARVEIAVPPRVDPGSATAFWQHLLGLLPARTRLLRRLAGAPHVSFEYEFAPGGLTIALWVPSSIPPPQIAAAVRSAWPGARTTIAPTRPAVDPAHAEAGGRLRLARPPRFPIATDHRTDPLRAVIGAASPLPVGQRVLVQVLARPVSSARMAALTRTRARTPAALAVRIAGLVASAAATLAQEIVTTLVHGPAHRATQPARPRTAAGPDRWVDSAQNRAAAGKAHGSGGGYRVAIRYLATIDSPPAEHDGGDLARAVCAARARAVGAAFAGYSGHNHFRRRPLHHPTTTTAARALRGGDLLSVAELAALAHLPTDEHVPGLRRAGAAAVAPPPQIPATGAGVRPLGDADAVPARPVGLSVADARHHVWVLGATGAGKSTLCVHGVLADAASGRAVVVIDPKGDLVHDIHTRLSDHARARTILIDPAHPGPHGWPSLNPLHTPDHRSASTPPGPEVGDTAVENVVSVFARVFSSAWGHRSEDLFRVACLTLRHHPGVASLDQIPELLTDRATRARLLTGVTDPRLLRFWRQFDQLSDPAAAQIAAPLLNKLRAVLLRPFAEQLLCRPTTVDLPRLLDRGGLLLVRIPKGVLGEDTVRLVGSLLVSQVWAAALTRITQPEHQRRDASLLVDECHNFLNLPYRIEDMLAEARGFRLSLTLAHQHLGQLTPALRDGIAANARNKILFQLSPSDAAWLARHTLPELGPHDLAHLDGFHAAAALLTDSAPARAFTLTTRPLPPAAAIPMPARVGSRADRPARRPNPGTARPDVRDPRLHTRPKPGSPT